MCVSAKSADVNYDSQAADRNNNIHRHSHFSKHNCTFNFTVGLKLIQYYTTNIKS